MKFRSPMGCTPHCEMKFLDLEMMEVWHNSPGKEAEPPPVKVAKLIEPVLIDCSMKFRSQAPDNMDRWKSRGGQSQRREEQKREDQRRERERGKKMQVPEKVAKSRNTVFPMICGSRGSKSRLAKAARAEPSGEMGDKKLHAAVARSRFRSQNAKSATCP